ncbi:MAG: DUF5320 domain-containing protein [Desulfatibacillum sp.]|nr:DUF5320 domain-containing protein [Desulfatibacillum sp.]
MPRGDGTGPMGAGPMSGRGAGFCGQGLRGTGRGLGMGRGMGYGMGSGRGLGNGRFAQAGPVDTDSVGAQDRSELESLKAQVQELKETITQFMKRETK